MKISFTKGISIVEIIISAAIIAVCVSGIVGAIQIYLTIVHQNAREAQATLLLGETAEAMQYLRDVSYEEHILNSELETDYSLNWTGTTYQLATSSIMLAYEMQRTIRFEEIMRDSSDQIVEDGGVLDQNTRKVIITVQWPYKGQTKTLTTEMLIHNIYEN